MIEKIIAGTMLAGMVGCSAYFIKREPPQFRTSDIEYAGERISLLTPSQISNNSMSSPTYLDKLPQRFAVEGRVKKYVSKPRTMRILDKSGNFALVPTRGITDEEWENVNDGNGVFYLEIAQMPSLYGNGSSVLKLLGCEVNGRKIVIK